MPGAQQNSRSANARAVPPQVAGVCEQCGAMFVSDKRSSNRPRQRFCGYQCAADARRKIGRRECVRCGVLFAPPGPRWRFCSWDCRTAKITKRCATCGAAFKVAPHRSARKFCSRKCVIRGGPFMKDYSCQYCGARFRRKPKTYTKFCGIRCAALARRYLVTIAGEAFDVRSLAAASGISLSTAYARYRGLSSESLLSAPRSVHSPRRLID